MKFLSKLFGNSEKARNKATQGTEMPQISAEPNKSETITNTDWGSLSFHGVCRKLHELGVRAEIMDGIERVCEQDFTLMLSFPFPIEKLAHAEEQIRAGDRESLARLEAELTAFLRAAIFTTTEQMPDL